jgi:uncharacterized protein (DUF2267 family)
MQYDEFLGRVQNRARLASSDEALKAAQATLEVLAQRLHGGEADDLAAQLPEQIGAFMKGKAGQGTFGLDAFFQQVSEKEGVDLPVGTHHARAVIAVVQDAVSGGELEDVREQLPQEYAPLFESGSEGSLN